MRAQPLINCRDVQASSHWYQRLLGCVGGHGGTEYQRLCDPNLHTSKWGSDGLILQLHAWEVDHHHGPMGDPSRTVGNGMLLWFEVDDFDAAVARARELAAPIVLDVHRNPNANHRELWIRDPDGYTVVLASPDGEAQEDGLMTASTLARPPGFPAEKLLIVTEIDVDNSSPLVLGVFRSYDDLLAGVAALLVERQFSFSNDDPEEHDYVTFDPDEHQLELKLLPEVDNPADDLDRNATAQIFIVAPAGALQHTGFYVWDSEQKWTAYAPLKLYWCTTPDGDEDWFIVAHTLTQAALQHAHAEGYDDDDASAEFIMTLPDALQDRGDDLLGWPDHDVLRTCGARFVREETPRVLELGGRTFSEGMLEHEIRKLDDDHFEAANQGRPNRTRRSTTS
jgi:catechol 2,3-dioxygenase-like lactoylglutathione lyase family enzyme